MQITVSGHHLEVTSALRDYVHNKLSRIERHFERATHAQIILSIDNKLEQKAEATIHVAGNDIFADACSNDMYAAIDNLIDKLDRQVKKHKEKRSKKNREQKHAVDAQQGHVNDDDDDGNIA